MPRLAAYFWLAFAAVLMVYRGVTQSVTIDEAFSYHLFLSQPWSAFWDRYDAAYHVLHTWATWLAVHKFGKSEAILRLPSMLAGLAYLAGCAAVCRRLLGGGWRFFAGCVLLSTEPLIADYLSAARGYGASLAFLVWAFDSLLAERPARASLLLGLGVACNLTIAVPAACAGVVYLLLSARQWKNAPGLILRLAGPFLAVAVPILAIPLSHATKDHFYYGSTDLVAALDTLLGAALAHGQPNSPAWVHTAAVWMPALGGAALLAAIGAGIKSRSKPLVLLCGTLLGSVLILVAAHAALGVLYPWTRSGLYLNWLFLAACLTLWGWAAERHGTTARILNWSAGAATVALCLAFLAQFETRYYFDFREDAPVRAMMQRIRDTQPGQPACIGGSWRFQPTVNYYRLRYRMTWIEEMQRTDTPTAACRFVLLSGEDRPYVEKLGLRPLWTDALSGTTLAEH